MGTIDKFYAIGKAPKQIRHDGICYKRDIVAEHKGSKVGSCMSWPLKSNSVAVHPDQISEFSDYSRKNGVPTDYDGEGRPIFTSAKHRKKYCRLYGYYDKDAGYSDPEPINS